MLTTVKRRLLVLASVVLLSVLGGANAQAQSHDNERINVLRLEMRADAFVERCEQQYSGTGTSDYTNSYGFKGRYFNLHMGGDLGSGFSYYFRQRIIANSGSSTFFDNTDFLWLNYKADENWSFRFGKDALAVGGFEYDAPPIDVYLPAYYWNQFYCFQLGMSAAFTTSDGQHTFRMQLANSPVIQSLSTGTFNRLAANILWSGNLGKFSTLYSIGLLTLGESEFDNAFPYIALGNKWTEESWSLYLDLMAHGQNYLSAVARADVKLGKVNLFSKCGYEWADQNGASWDYLSRPSMNDYFLGVGLEHSPSKCKSVRIHAFASLRHEEYEAAPKHDDTYLTVNVGLTWNVDIKKVLNK